MRSNQPKNITLLKLGTMLLVFYVAVANAVSHAQSRQFTDLLVEGKNLLEQGSYLRALSVLEHAEQQVTTDAQRALVAGSSGIAHYQLGHRQEAEALLRKAMSYGSAPPREQARWTALLAKILLDQDQQDSARELFTKALMLSETDRELTAGIELQQISMLPLQSRLTKLQEIKQNLIQLPPTNTRSNYLLRLAELAYEIGTAAKELGFTALMAAKDGANNRQQPEISSKLAQLYEDDRRYQEALELNQRALGQMLNLEAPEAALELHWREGRLHKQLSHFTEALNAYQRAIDLVETIRHDIPLTYRNGESSFRATLEPLYQQMADLLLTLAKQRNISADKVSYLRRARSVAELVKQAELEDFLGGRCAVQPVRKALLESIAPQTAVLYPVMLPDRLELLVSVDDRIQQFTADVDLQTLRNAVYQYVGALRSAHPDEKAYAINLYRWLVAPIQPLLQSQHVQNLVIVPDSFLRLMPFASLHDGNRYLVEQYAVSTSPGLSIIEPSGIQPRQAKALIAGLSEPGDVIRHLPDALQQELRGSGVRGALSPGKPRSRGLEFIANTSLGPQTSENPQDQAKQVDEAMRNSIKAALSLPGVVNEISRISSALTSTVLLNRDFTVERFRQELLEEPYAIVHIASHLIAGKNSEASFLLAHDDVIKFDQLESLLKTNKFARQPIDLLTLSACQTAEGDDRAPLGLSGLALKAKVRSALGTLWPVNDEAAPVLMTALYKALNEKGTGKAQALRQAQLTLLKQAKFSHPFYWAPYILVGNWL